MSRSPAVDTYLAACPPFAQPLLRHLRKLVHQACPAVSESIKWSHISFDYQGRILCFFAAFKAHASFGFWHQEVVKRIANEGVKTSEAHGSLGRLKDKKDLPNDKTLLRYLKMAMELQVSGKSPRQIRKPRPALPMPPGLADALRRNARAAAHWEKFSPSARRDYIEWITDAKRDETREQRLLTTLDWVGEGRKRHWKHEAR